MSTSLAASLADILRRELDGTHPLIVIDTDDETEVRETAPNAIDASIEARHWSALRGISKGRFLDEFAKDIPLRRVAEPVEVARLALWLASDESAYATGADFLLDGGVRA